MPVDADGAHTRESDHFYQFKSADSVAAYFAVLISKRRGRALCRALTRMCMGWRHAPCIAQRSSRTILLELRRRLLSKGLQLDDFYADVWIDNFIFAAHTLDVLNFVLTTFEAVALDLNLKLHPPSPQSSVVDVLGFSVDLASKVIRHSSKWVSKVTEFWTSHSHIDAVWSFRDWAKMVGNLVWMAYARRLPLCFIPQTLTLARSLAVEGPGHWESNANHLKSADLMLELAALVDAIPNAFTYPSPLPLELTLMSDAATGDGLDEAFWAFISEDEHSGESCSFAGPIPFSEEHIFFMELRSAMHALLHAAFENPAQRVNIGIDNSAALFALRSGHSGNGIADAWIARFYRALPSTFQFYALHVPSELNRSDRFTRGLRPQNYFSIQGLHAWPGQRIPQNSPRACSSLMSVSSEALDISDSA